MADQIFISYARKDKAVAKTLAEALRPLGVYPWLDEFELKPDIAWEDQIRAALVGSKAMVVVLSDGPASPNVAFEAGAAMAHGAQIIAVITGQSTDARMFSKSTAIYALNSADFETAAQEVVAAIDKHTLIV